MQCLRGSKGETLRGGALGVTGLRAADGVETDEAGRPQAPLRVGCGGKRELGMTLASPPGGLVLDKPV